MRINPILTSVMAIAACLPLATVAFAGPPKTAPKKADPVPAKIKCAVETGDVVDVKAATTAKRYADYKGNRYFFCCTDCPKEFKENPAKYAKNAHIKTPVAPAKSSVKG